MKVMIDSQNIALSHAKKHMKAWHIPQIEEADVINKTEGVPGITQMDGAFPSKGPLGPDQMFGTS